MVGNVAQLFHRIEFAGVVVKQARIMFLSFVILLFLGCGGNKDSSTSNTEP